MACRSAGTGTDDSLAQSGPVARSPPMSYSPRTPSQSALVGPSSGNRRKPHPALPPPARAVTEPADASRRLLCRRQVVELGERDVRPLLASATAMAAPIPCCAPVTSETLPTRPMRTPPTLSCGSPYSSCRDALSDDGGG